MLFRSSLLRRNFPHSKLFLAFDKSCGMISALFNVGLALLPQGSTGHKYISAVRRAEKTGVYCWLAYIRPSVEGLGTSCHAFLRLFAIPPSKGPGYLAPVLEGGHDQHSVLGTKMTCSPLPVTQMQ